MTTLKFVKCVIVISLKVQQYLVELYLKSVGKQVEGDELEAHFTTRPIDISCSKDVPTKHNKDVLQNMIMRISHYVEQPIEH